MENIRLGIFPNMNIVKVRVHFDAILERTRAIVDENLAKASHDSSR